MRCLELSDRSPFRQKFWGKIRRKRREAKWKCKREVFDSTIGRAGENNLKNEAVGANRQAQISPSPSGQHWEIHSDRKWGSGHVWYQFESWYKTKKALEQKLKEDTSNTSSLKKE